MTRDEALKLLHEKMQNQNLRRHCYAVEAVMKALAKHFGEDEEEWGIAGLLHDADYEITKDNPEEHTRMVVRWLEDHSASDEVKQAILAHGWGFVEGNPEPKTNMDWSLYCCDELTGLIVACALVKPSKKLADVTVETVKNKWGQKAFAAGVDREQIEMCDEKLDIPLDKFIEIALTSMQEIHEELGL